MDNFWKKLKLKKILTGFLLGSVVIAFLVWFSLPFLVEWGLSGVARDSGFSEFEVEVEQVDPWLTRLSKIEMRQKEQVSLGVDQIDLVYEPGSLAEGKIDAISITGLDLRIQADEGPHGGQSKGKEFEPLEEILGQFLEAPYLTHLRVRDSKLDMTLGGQSYPVDFLLKGDFHNQIGRLIVDGALHGFQFKSKVDVAKERGKTYLTGEVKFPDLAKSAHLLESIDSFGSRLPEDFVVKDGQLELTGSARVDSDSLRDLFLELNASDLELEASGHDLNISDAFLFLSPDTMDDWQANLYANLELDKQLKAKGLKLSVKAQGGVYELSGGASQLMTTGDLPPVEIMGLRFPILDMSIPLALPVGQEQKFFFDKVSYDNGLFTFIDGNLSVEIREENSLVSVFLDIGDALFGEIGFVDFSYEGLLDFEEFPKVSRKQLVSGRRIMLGLEAGVENPKLAFRLDSLERILIDLLTFEAGGVSYELNPAKLLVKVSEEKPESPVFVFQGSSFSFPQQDILVEGIKGEIALSSIEPLATKGPQTVSFDRIVLGDMETGEGNFSFQIEPDGTIVIERARAGLWGGEVGLLESSFNMYGDDYRLNTRVAGIDGQRVADLLAKEDIEIDGNFSGDITFSNEEGKWDFSNGLVLLDPSPTAWMSYSPGTVVLNSLKKGSKEYEKMKLTNEAMEGLSLDAMRILFKALDGKREVEIFIRGKSETGNRTIHLDNNLNFIAGIRELVGAYFDFSNLGIDLSKFGIDLKNFDIQ